MQLGGRRANSIKRYVNHSSASSWKLDLNDDCRYCMWIKATARLKQMWAPARSIKWFMIWNEEFLSQEVRGERSLSVSGLSLPLTTHNLQDGSCHVPRLSLPVLAGGLSSAHPYGNAAAALLSFVIWSMQRSVQECMTIHHHPNNESQHSSSIHSFLRLNSLTGGRSVRHYTWSR